MDCRGLLCGMGNTGSMTSADELNEQYDADGSVTQVPERNDEVHAGESAVAQSRESAVTIPAGTVVLAATPIGNVGDASARLVALLERADIVAAEDTRRLYDLARRLGVYVNGRVIAYHDHNERDKADGLLDQVETGATVLVVSDAGMPTINDPGLAIVRRAIERGLPVTCAPGSSAVLDALALSGLPTDRFCYEASYRESIPSACSICARCCPNAAPSCSTRRLIALPIRWTICWTRSARIARWPCAANSPRIMSRFVAARLTRFTKV